MNSIKFKTDAVEWHISQENARYMLFAVNSVMQELLYIHQKLLNRIQYDYDLLMTNEQAQLMAKLLEYQSDYVMRCASAVIDQDYADKKTALELIEMYERTSKRLLYHSKRLKSAANKCVTPNLV